MRCKKQKKSALNSSFAKFLATAAVRGSVIIFLPPPDFEARKLMFELYLKKRPTEIGLNYEELAKATENYVSSDIKFLCDEASRKALKDNLRITKSIVLETIRSNKPSISLQELNSYLVIKAKMEGENDNNNDRPRIGFRT